LAFVWFFGHWPRSAESTQIAGVKRIQKSLTGGDAMAEPTRKADPWAPDWCLAAGMLLAGVALGRQPFVDKLDAWMLAAGAGGVLFCGLAFWLAGRKK
jgi:hypothetical protein